MRTNHLMHAAGVAAYLNAIANIISSVSLIVFFAVGEPFGTINDSASVCFSLSLIPLALLLHRWHRSQFPAPSLVITSLGMAAMLTAALLQAALVLGIVQFGQTLREVLFANAIIGVWLLATGLVARRAGTLPPYLTWLMMSAGGGLIAVVVGFWIGGRDHPLAASGGLIAVISLVIWAVGLGRLVRQERLNGPTYAGEAHAAPH